MGKEKNNEKIQGTKSHMKKENQKMALEISKQKTKMKDQEKKDPPITSKKFVQQQPGKLGSTPTKPQAKQSGSHSSPSIDPSREEVDKGQGKDAKAGHQPKMKTISPTSSSRETPKQKKENPENGDNVTRKIEFNSKLVNDSSVPENALHSDATTEGLAMGGETAMAVDNC
ncbi:unnamed protein product [Linum trigynum]|uniref:Uncharacterized protein n=1 Tax=Linum trigynum TaxID=586398 RepID=A0AAV2C9G8_9ROSI